MLFTVNPLTHSPTPEVSVDRHTIYGCPIYTVTFWDFPCYIPPVLRASLKEIEDALEADLDSFLTCLEVAIEDYYQPFPPLVEEEQSFLLPHPPCLTPSFDVNPNTIPLDTIRSEFRLTPDTVLHQIYLPGFRLLSQWGKLCCAIGNSKRSK